MNFPLFRILLCAALLALQCTLPTSARAEPKVLGSGESVDLGAVFWTDGCSSTLITIVGVDLLEGPPGVKLSVRGEDVVPGKQDCPKVPGGMVVASVKEVRAPVTATLKYRVRYKTANGSRQSEHSVELSLQP